MYMYMQRYKLFDQISCFAGYHYAGHPNLSSTCYAKKYFNNYGASACLSFVIQVLKYENKQFPVVCEPNCEPSTWEEDISSLTSSCAVY